MLPSTRIAIRAILNADPSLTVFARATIMAAINEKNIDPSLIAPRLLRRKEVAKRLSVSERTIDLWVREGLLQKIVLPGRIRGVGFKESDINQLIENHKVLREEEKSPE
jgi:predicted DNA-binding transcriptional regulator AlpA